MSEPTDLPDTPTDADASEAQDARATRAFVSSREFEPTIEEQPADAAPTISSPALPTAATVVDEPARDRDRRGGAGRTLGLGLLVALLGFGGGIAGFYVSDQYLADDAASSAGALFQPTNDEPEPRSTSSSDGDLPTPREIYRNMSPAVAHIDARIVKTETNFFGLEEEQEGSGTGSGFIVDDEGHIVTNAHVVEDARELTVSLGVDNVEVPAELVGADPSSDIAVLKFDPEADELDGVELAIAEFGDSSKAQVGDPVLAIGNPFGLDRTLTTGVVSALQRNIPALNDFTIGDVIQTDAAVNPGNSGGPLLDGHGDVIGVNSQIQSRGGGFDGVAFAVPSNTVEKVARELMKSGSVDYAWLGVEGGELTSELAEELDVDVDHGVYLSDVPEGSPAHKAGLKGGTELQNVETGETIHQGGDVLLTFDGKELESMTQLGSLVDASKPGDKVEVEYLRDGKREKTTVTLGDRPSGSSSSDEDDEG